ncbi:hypothetical protein [Chitinimonas sp. BJB300]|uniref:hypothetical protein n=1 Tax=Chitinimonas sp. BJB300 TaxID=1559339 RepID=UPI000C0DD197|nr:hypothetical protein [Chitinimonas sp. BJB300]PHV12973.1 hypothetical protein CSQ89_03080 [Chitinimonas sp. BJB300]TSJ89074.1 hypothetical protein FG002_009380 [Chitinimonas sp. BJB300]
MLAAALATIAIVSQDQSALRAAPRESAPRQAVLWQGDSLEVRGQKGDYLQVYDHRRERAGYVRATQVRNQSLTPESAPELLSVVRFLRDMPGSEALGISYVATYLRAAPAAAINGEAFDALGTMAERLARRASANRANTANDMVAAHLEVAASYGVGMASFERNGQMQLCYNGDAHRRVLAMPATDNQKATAALALTREDCISPTLPPVERFALDNWRAEVLDRIETRDLPEVLKNRLRLRKASVWASLAYQRARRPEFAPAALQAAGSRALSELAAINKSELMETDEAAYNDAAIRVGASRWAAEPTLARNTAQAPTKLSIAVSPGQPGETCVHLVDAKHDQTKPLLTRCTFSVVWPASATTNAQGTALALAVQPLDTWREMWLFRQGQAGWDVQALPPALDNPNLGYVEFAGWVPGNTQMLTARETRVEDRYKRSFDLRRMDTLAVEKQADKPNNLSTFYRWQSPAWKGQTVSVR